MYHRTIVELPFYPWTLQNPWFITYKSFSTLRWSFRGIKTVVYVWKRQGFRGWLGSLLRATSLHRVLNFLLGGGVTTLHRVNCGVLSLLIGALWLMYEYYVLSDYYVYVLIVTSHVEINVMFIDNISIVLWLSCSKMNN